MWVLDGDRCIWPKSGVRVRVCALSPWLCNYLTFLSSLCPLFLSSSPPPSPFLSFSLARFISLLCCDVGTCLSMRRCMCVSVHYVYLVCLSSSLGVCSCNHLSHSCLYYSPKTRTRLATWQRCWQAIGTPHTHASNMASYTAFTCTQYVCT